MQGFFVKKEEIKHKTARAASRGKSKTAVYSCATCGLDQTCTTPRMPVHGEGKKRILVIAEAPGEVALC